ncbi:MAG: hypothetical protein ACOZBL_05470 [Patescibacteria group bacterium]
MIWDDGIARQLKFDEWHGNLISNNPDLIVFETKTPTVKMFWKIIDDIKKTLPDTKIVLVGDHVTAFPIESLENSKVDYVLCG